MRTCPGCGYPTARLKRLDHYLSLFFIPLFRVKQGDRFLECDRCDLVSDETGRASAEPTGHRNSQKCSSCGRSMEAGFRFCPHCGADLSRH